MMDAREADWDPDELEERAQQQRRVTEEDLVADYLHRRHIRVAPERVTEVAGGLVASRPRALPLPDLPETVPFNVAILREIRLSQKQGLFSLRQAQWLLELSGFPMPPTRQQRLLSPLVWLWRRYLHG